MFLCAISGAFTGLAISMNNSVPAKEREQNKSTIEIGNKSQHPYSTQAVHVIDL